MIEKIEVVVESPDTIKPPYAVGSTDGCVEEKTVFEEQTEIDGNG